MTIKATSTPARTPSFVCDRCGGPRGHRNNRKTRLCRPCVDVLTPEERKAWEA